MVNILISQPKQEKEISFLEPELITINSPSDKSTLVAQIQEMSPEIVAVDLSINSGLDTISFLAQNFIRLKILAINAKDKSSMLKAIALGANGSTRAEIAPGEWELVFQSLKQECVLVDSKRAENPHFIILPKSQIEQRLEKWQYWIGIEMIDFWRAELFPYNLSLESCFLELGIPKFIVYFTQGQGKFSIFKELDRIFESLCLKNNDKSLATKLESHSSVLSEWYFNEIFTTSNNNPNCCLAMIRANVRACKKASVFKIRKLLNLWQKAGSYTLSQWLEEVISSLKKKEIDFLKTRQEALTRASFSKIAYQNLVKKLKADEQQYYFDSALRALKLQYVDTIRAEVNQAASQIIGELLDELYAYAQKVTSSDTFIYSIQEKLQIKISQGYGDTLLPDLSWSEAEVKRFSFVDIRRDLENYWGKSINYWGDFSSDEHEIIQLKILELSRNLALSLILEQY